MPYGKLLAEDRIRLHGWSEDQARQRIGTLLLLAERELADSGVAGLSLDGRYEHAYAAVRAWGEAAMAAEGYRPTTGTGQHHVVFAFLRVVSTAQWAAEAEYFDACRQRRNAAAYHGAEVVTETELDDLVAEARRFGEALRQWLSAQHPTLGPSSNGSPLPEPGPLLSAE